MRQLSYEISNVQEIEPIFQQLQVQFDCVDPQSILLQIYSAKTDESYIQALLDEVYRVCPHIHVAGLTTFHNISDGDRVRDQTILNVTLFESSQVEVYEFKIQENYLDSIEKTILNTITKIPSLKGIQVYITNTYERTIKLVDKLSCGDWVVFGARAGYKGSIKEVRPKVFSRHIMKDGLILVLYKGDNLNIFAEYCLGWRALGKEMTVTKTHNLFTVESIDHLPAAEIYNKYLNVIPNEDFLDNIYEFPMILARGEREISRTPFNYDEEGKLYFNADIYEGETIRLSYGNKKHLLSASKSLSDKVKAFQPEVVYIIACINRVIFLKDDVQEELDFFKRLTYQVTGFYGFSEIIAQKESSGFMHSSLLAIGMREGECVEAHQLIENEIDCKEKDSKISYSERLVAFLEATTQELKASNERLEAMALTDRLTGLMNRRKIEDIFEYEKNRMIEGTALALLIIDADHFKSVNDSFGHDVGDQVLTQLARLLKESVRRGDSVGRWGGEEFVGLLPHCQLSEAIEIAENIRKAIANFHFDKVGHVTVSVGLTLRRGEEAFAPMFERADQALYLAKDLGRNLVKVI